MNQEFLSPPDNPAAAPDAPWPTFRHDHRNTGCSTLQGIYRGDQPWTFSTGKGIFSTPVIDGRGNIYLGSADHYFYALTPQGDLRWKYKTGEIIDSAGALPRIHPAGTPTVIFPSGDGSIYCLEADTGVERWSFDGSLELSDHFNNWFEGNIALGPNGTLFAGNTNFHYYSLTPQGDLKWTYKTGSNAWSIAGFSPQGTIIWGSCDTFIHGVSQAGELEWKKRTLGFVSASAAVAQDGTAYIGSFDSALYALEAATGKQKWKFRTDDHIYSSAALLETESGDHLVLVGSTDGYLYAVNQDGKQVWRYYSGAPIRSSPAVGKKPPGEKGWIVYFGNGAGKLFALQVEDGTRRWSYDTTVQTPELADRNDLNGSPALGTGGVVIGGEHGQVCYVPYDYPRYISQPHSSVHPGEELPASQELIHYVSPGGKILTDPPDVIPSAGILTFCLRPSQQPARGRCRLNNPPFNRGKKDLVVQLDPPVPFHSQISADGQFLHLIPDGFLPPGSNLRVTLTGSYFHGGLKIGNLKLGGRKKGSFQREFDFQIRDSQPSPLANLTGPENWTCLEWTRLAVPIPTMLPSLNQIGFDYLSWLIGLVKYLPPRSGKPARVICWAVGARRDADNQLVVDPDSDFALPLTGTVQENGIILTNQQFQLKITGIPIPFQEFQIRCELDQAGYSLPGASVYARTSVLSIPNFGPAMIIAGLANQIWKNLVAVGTCLVRPCPPAFQEPDLARNITAAALNFAPPTHRSPGKVTASLRLIAGSCPAQSHRGSILLLNGKTDRVINLNYHQLLHNQVDSAGDLSTVELTIPAGTSFPEQVQAVVLLDTTPIYQGLLTP